MKTIKEYLEKTDRKRILDAIDYETRTDWLYLKEHGDISVNEIVRQYTECINTFINRLVNVETAPSDRIVCYTLCFVRGGSTITTAELENGNVF